MSDNSPSVGLRQKLDLDAVVVYLTSKVFPSKCKTGGEKTNFRRQCRPYTYVDGKLMYSKLVKNETSQKKDFVKVQVIRDVNEQLEIIKIIHEGGDTSLQSKALSAHRGRIATFKILSSRFYWANFSNDVAKYIAECPACQTVNTGSGKLKVAAELHPVGVPKQPMRQIGVDLAALPEVDGFKYIVVAIDYFTKWSEAEPLTDKSAVSVASFLYRLICRHGCFRIQINDQGREFVNQVSDELHVLTGVHQRITSAYHPQANGLVERQNRTIKSSLLKVLGTHTKEWPKVLDGVLFAHRSVKHNSTGYSPFYMLYQREPELPVDMLLQMDIEDPGQPIITSDDNDGSSIEEAGFNEAEYNEILKSILAVRDIAHNRAMDNIKVSQESQKRAYDRRHNTKKNEFSVGAKVLVKNLRRNDRKGGWSQSPWLGPFVVKSTFKNTCLLQNILTGQLQKTRQNISNLKFYRTRDDATKGATDGAGGAEGAPAECGSGAEAGTGEGDDAGGGACGEAKDECEKGAESGSGKEGAEDSAVLDEIEFVSEAHAKLVFMPVTKKWQQYMCASLRLPLHNCHPVMSIKELKAPKRIVRIIGDGNCWFRAVSYWITGSEGSHQLVREKVVEHMHMLQNAVDDYADKPYYLVGSNMSLNGVWATDVEIKATASLLHTDIYVYGRYGAGLNWQHFTRNGFAPKSINEEPCMSIYINHADGSHYEVVTDVERKDDCNLLSVPNINLGH